MFSGLIYALLSSFIDSHIKCKNYLCITIFKKNFYRTMVSDVHKAKTFIFALKQSLLTMHPGVPKVPQLPPNSEMSRNCGKW